MSRLLIFLDVPDAARPARTAPPRRVRRKDDADLVLIGDAPERPNADDRLFEEEEIVMLEFIRDNPIAGAIIACEVGLWVVLGVGLALRYLARLQRTSTVVLAAIPLLDVVLVVATALDLHRGNPVGMTHGLAGVYLGFSVAFGPSIVRWADVRFAHRFADGPAPVKGPKSGPQKRARLWREWFRVLIAASIASVVLLGLSWLFASPEQAPMLYGWITRVWMITGIWLVAGPLFESGKAKQQVKA